MAGKRETMMSVGEGPSGGGVNPMLETRVLDWILSDFDEEPSSGKEGCAGEGAAKWAVGEFRKTRHPRNVESNGILKVCFSGAGNSRI
jgi:hypothetical protein